MNREQKAARYATDHLYQSGLPTAVRRNLKKPKRLVARCKAASFLTISPRTLDYIIARGDLPVRRINKRVFVPRRALERFARPGSAETTQ